MRMLEMYEPYHPVLDTDGKKLQLLYQTVYKSFQQKLY